VLWGVALGAGQVLIRGEPGKRALFVLPAVLFTVAVVIFPTLFGFYIRAHDWNLSAAGGPNSTASIISSAAERPVFLERAAEYGVLFGRRAASNTPSPSGWRSCCNAEIRRASFFRSPSCCPFMLQPVGVSWMIGKVAAWSSLRSRLPAGAPARLERTGLLCPAVDGAVQHRRPWTPGSSIPFIMMLLLAGLQAMPKELTEAAKVDGATAWQAFWKITFSADAAGQRHGDRAEDHLQARSSPTS
jgi:multiple sugar transport system permease protein